MDSSFCPHPWQAGQKGVPWERTEGTMDFLEIEKVKGREIIDSRGNPTVEVDVILDNGICASASVVTVVGSIPSASNFALVDSLN